MQTLFLLVGVVLASLADSPECRNAPSRTSDAYWDYVDACGCANLEAPSRASQDYDRFLKACSRWRERNPQVNVIVSNPPLAGSTPSAAGTSPADSAECRNTPSRASDSYWDYIEACGCAKLEAPSSASQDYDRFLKACSRWRERNPQVNVIVPNAPAAGTAPAPTPGTGVKPKATPSPSPQATSQPGAARER